MGFALTSTFDAWTAGYSEPGFCGTAGLTLAGVGVALSTFGIIVGVTDFDTGADDSMDEGRWDSFRRLAWRGCGLVESQRSKRDGFRKDTKTVESYSHLWRRSIGRRLCDDIEIVLNNQFA